MEKNVVTTMMGYIRIIGVIQGAKGGSCPCHFLAAWVQ